jgi:hypothetical protein
MLDEKKQDEARLAVERMNKKKTAKIQWEFESFSEILAILNSLISFFF